nr:immunoglobulin heavy chain junction region [Macaca mulatta]
CCFGTVYGFDSW